MRMMHAANHLCYGEFAGHDVNTLVLRRNLLSEQELESLKRAGGNFYLCAVRRLCTRTQCERHAAAASRGLCAAAAQLATVRSAGHSRRCASRGSIR